MSLRHVEPLPDGSEKDGSREPPPSEVSVADTECEICGQWKNGNFGVKQHQRSSKHCLRYKFWNKGWSWEAACKKAQSEWKKQAASWNNWIHRDDHTPDNRRRPKSPEMGPVRVKSKSRTPRRDRESADKGGGPPLSPSISVSPPPAKGRVRVASRSSPPAKQHRRAALHDGGDDRDRRHGGNEGQTRQSSGRNDPGAARRHRPTDDRRDRDYNAVHVKSPDNYGREAEGKPNAKVKDRKPDRKPPPSKPAAASAVKASANNAAESGSYYSSDSSDSSGDDAEQQDPVATVPAAKKGAKPKAPARAKTPPPPPKASAAAPASSDLKLAAVARFYESQALFLRGLSDDP